MGQFSWLDCKTQEQIFDNEYRDVFLLVPKEFGGGHIKEECYDGYGRFGGYDAYALLAQWNKPLRCIGDPEHDRLIGIDIGCYDDQMARLKYPLKITYDKDAVYEECGISFGDPNQGWHMEYDDEEWW